VSWIWPTSTGRLVSSALAWYPLNQGRRIPIRSIEPETTRGSARQSAGMSSGRCGVIAMIWRWSMDGGRSRARGDIGNSSFVATYSRAPLRGGSMVTSCPWRAKKDRFEESLKPSIWTPDPAPTIPTSESAVQANVARAIASSQTGRFGS
jgi:hypothetical protein